MTNPRNRRTFPAVPTVRNIIAAAGGRRLVVVAPHPDDETLGCGRLLHAAVRAGVAVGVVALTDGDASHTSLHWPPPRLAAVRRAELRRALARLGAGRAPVVALGWPDGGVARAGRITALSRALSRLGAGVVLAPSPRDHHPDHRAGFAIAIAAVRALRLPLVAYAVWSRVDARGPRARGPASAAKAWAVAAHRSQVGGYIADDPDGFRLTPRLLAGFVGGTERFTVRL